jgi:hypothetical protein
VIIYGLKKRDIKFIKSRKFFEALPNIPGGKYDTYKTQPEFSRILSTILQLRIHPV